MDIDNLNKRVIALSAEAKRRSTVDMWKVRSDQRPIPRIGKTVLGGVFRSEAVRTFAVKRIARSLSDLTFLGHGFEQIAMTDGQQVFKLLFNTVHHDEAHVEDIAQKAQIASNTCRDFLGDYWLETDFSAVKLPDARTFAVVARQELLRNPRLLWSADELEAGPERAKIAEDILALHGSTGMLPDILASDNIAIRSEGGVCQIDTIPVPEEFQSIVPSGQTFTNGQLILNQVSRWLEA